MTSSNPPNFARLLVLIAGIFLLAAPQGALAKHKDHSDDHGGMSSNDSSDDHGDKHSDDHKDKNKDHAEKDMKFDKHKGKHKDDFAEKDMNSDKHKGKHKDKESTEKDTEQDKTTGTVPTAGGNTPTADSDLFRKGVVGQTPTDIKPIPSPAAPGTVSGPGAGATNAVRAVTISNGKGGSFQIPDHGAGVTVTSGGPGKLTISNGVQTQTVSGIAWTISGASTVAVSKGLGVGRPDTPGSVVVLSPNGTVTGGSGEGGIIGGFEDGIKDIAGHLDPRPGFEAGIPKPGTSTIQQQ